MPSYTMRNTKTDEIKDMVMSFSDREKFLIDNTEWVQVLSAPKIVSGVKSTLSRTDDGWKETLKKIKKGSGKGNTINL